MKTGTTQSGKFTRLVRRLRELLGPLPVSHETVAVGLLERLWHATAAGAWLGDIGRYSNEEICELVGWTGDASALINLLLECAWLDRSTEHRLVVHDWHIHATNTIQNNAKRHGKEFASLRKDAPKELPKEPPKEPPKESPQGTSSLPDLTKPTLPDQPKSAGDTPAPPVSSPDQIAPSPETPKAPSKSAKSPKPQELPPAIPAALASSEPFRAAWDAWLKYRTRRRLTCRPETLAKQLELLASLGPQAACTSIEDSIRSGWQGLFQPKGPNGRTRITNGPGQTYTGEPLGEF